MNRFRNNKRKRFASLILIVLLLSISLGYAILSTNLNIVGTTSINNPTWNIRWDNLNVTNGSVTGTQVTTAAYIKSSTTEVEYSITLKTPGDYYEFTVDAVNDGSVDAMIGSFSNKVYQANGTTERDLPEYLTYSVTYNDGVAIAKNQLLAANTTEKYKVRVEFKKDINASQLPSSADTLVFKFNVTYIQADINAVNKPNPTVYTASTHALMNIGSAIPNGVVTYSTYQEVINSDDLYRHSFFLAHTINNNLISESYVGFINNDSVYYLRGAGATCNGNTCNNDSPYYTLNKEILINALGSSNCDVDISCDGDCYYTRCSGPDGWITARTNGTVAVGFYDAECVVEANGSSYCIIYI